MGNSIGGFTVASVAAALSVSDDHNPSSGVTPQGNTVTCSGLVLMNSAGRILDGVGLTDTPQGDLFPIYAGPKGWLLRAFGRFVITVMQPQIAKTCEWLYPTNPAPVRGGLAGGILRDSRDPGAWDVIAAGTRLCGSCWY